MHKVALRVLSVVLLSGCGGSVDGGDSNGAERPSLLDVLLRHNEVHVAGIEIQCEWCGCGGIVGGEPEARVCMDRVIREQHPSLVEPVRSYHECLIPIAEEKLACYQSAADCPAAEACASAADPDEAACLPAEIETAAYADLVADLESQCGDG